MDRKKVKKIKSLEAKNSKLFLIRNLMCVWCCLKKIIWPVSWNQLIKWRGSVYTVHCTKSMFHVYRTILFNNFILTVVSSFSSVLFKYVYRTVHTHIKTYFVKFEGSFSHSPLSGLENGSPAIPDFYKEDELKYHGRSNRGLVKLNLLQVQDTLRR